MRGDSDEEAWRAIVENYGDRPALDADEPPDDGATAVTARPVPPPAADPLDRFVPPPPPPVPRPTYDRLVAWTALFGSPAVLLLALVLGVRLPQVVALGMVAAFVAGFVYLVVAMPRGPRDPGDDGARL